MSSVEQIATKIEEVAELLSLQSDHPKRDRADILRDVMVEAGRELMEHAAALREQPEARGVVDVIELGRLLVREREAVGGAFTPDWLLFREALTQQPAQAAPGDDEVQRNAERYEWLRDNCEIDSTFCDAVRLDFPLGPEVEGFDTLDEAIDAAMAATPPGDDAAGGGHG